MLDEMCATLGGRAAEKVIFNKISTGALSDLEKVTKQARAMVTVYGLNEEVGNITYYDSSGNDSFVKPYSDDTAKKIDEEISKMIEAQYQRAIELLDNNKEKLTVLAELLLEKEVIFKDDLLKVFGKRPFEEIDTEIKDDKVIEEEVNVSPIEENNEE
jgi:AFG3 family protein